MKRGKVVKKSGLLREDELAKKSQVYLAATKEARKQVKLGQLTSHKEVFKN